MLAMLTVALAGAEVASYRITRTYQDAPDQYHAAHTCDGSLGAPTMK
ncbi:MAG TPA: hypothetical protein VH277_09225 [Gemmatimonadaceae bacterium]|nr:hypothetical protein [Gemmatimonadaceae bacterium]